MDKELKNTCSILEMPASSIKTKLSKLLKLANILQETNCEIVIMNNQVTILPKREV